MTAYFPSRVFKDTKACFESQMSREACSSLEEYAASKYAQWGLEAVCTDVTGSSTPSPSTSSAQSTAPVSAEDLKTEVESVVPDCSLDPVVTCLDLLTKYFSAVMHPVNSIFRDLSKMAGKGGEEPPIMFRDKGAANGRRKRDAVLPPGFKLPPPPSRGSSGGLPGLGGSFGGGKPGDGNSGSKTDQKCDGPFGICQVSTTAAPLEPLTLSAFEDFSYTDLRNLNFDRGCR